MVHLVNQCVQGNLLETLLVKMFPHQTHQHEKTAKIPPHINGALHL